MSSRNKNKKAPPGENHNQINAPCVSRHHILYQSKNKQNISIEVTLTGSYSLAHHDETQSP